MRLAVSVNGSPAAVLGLDGPGTYVLNARASSSGSAGLTLTGSGLRDFEDGHRAHIREVEVRVPAGDEVRVDVLESDSRHKCDMVHFPAPGRSLLVPIANLVTAASSLREDADSALRDDLVSIVREVLPFLEDDDATSATRRAALALLGRRTAQG